MVKPFKDTLAIVLNQQFLCAELVSITPYYCSVSRSALMITIPSPSGRSGGRRCWPSLKPSEPALASVVFETHHGQRIRISSGVSFHLYPKVPHHLFIVGIFHVVLTITSLFCLHHALLIFQNQQHDHQVKKCWTCFRFEYTTVPAASMDYKIPTQIGN